MIEVIGAADFWVFLNAFLIELVPHEMSGAWVNEGHLVARNLLEGRQF